MANQMTVQNNKAPSPPRDFSRSDRAFISALKALLDVNAFDEIHVLDLVRKSGFSKGAFYRQHEDKYYFAKDIVRHLAQGHGYYLKNHSDLRLRGHKINSNEIFNSSKALIDYIYKNRELYCMVIDNKLPEAGFDDFVKWVMEYGFGIQQDFTSDSFIPYVTISTSLTYVSFWSLNGFALSADELAQLALDYESLAYASFPEPIRPEES